MSHESDQSRAGLGKGPGDIWSGEGTGEHGQNCSRTVRPALSCPGKTHLTLTGTDQKEADFTSNKKHADGLTPSQNSVLP